VASLFSSRVGHSRAARHSVTEFSIIGHIFGFLVNMMVRHNKLERSSLTIIFFKQPSLVISLFWQGLGKER
jgi:hypothetical protein